MEKPRSFHSSGELCILMYAMWIVLCCYVHVCHTNLQILAMIIFALTVGIIYFDIDSEDLAEDDVENVFSDRYVCLCCS